MKSIKTWSKNHMLLTGVILFGVGYIVYNKYMKDTNKQMADAGSGGTTNFTGSQKASDTYFTNKFANASGGGEPVRTH